MFHIKQFKAMLGFVNIHQVADVDFERRTIRFHWCGSVADFIVHGIDDCVECFGLLCISSKPVFDSFTCYQVNCLKPVEVDNIYSLPSDASVSVFVDVKTV